MNDDCNFLPLLFGDIIMLIPIAIPHGICLTDIRRLRLHAAWYKRQIKRHGKEFETNRFAKARKRQLEHLLTETSEPVLVGMS